MLRSGVAAAALLVLVLTVPAVLASGPHGASAPRAPGLPQGTGLAPPPTGAQLLQGILRHNLTGPSATPTPVSGYQETPPPPVPATTPTVVHVATNAQGCCFYANKTPAGGPWDSVVLNYTGTIVAGVYDSSYRAYVGGAQVLFGTTPEYGTWTVLQNLTEYEALLEPGANFTFILSAAVVTGYFETSLTLSFYPPPPGGPVPSEPSQVLPLWTKYVQASLPVVSGVATVPSDASAVSLQLWAYGFGSTGGDEFWWASPTPARSVELSLDGSPFAAVYPFPYVNTGGVDLFLWRPIPAAYTLSDRPYDVNLTGALGKLDGTHTYNVTIGGRVSADPWWTAGSLFVWTDPSVTGATLTGSGATWPAPNTAGNTVSSSTSFHYQSTLATSAGPVAVSTSAAGSFRETEAQVVGGTNGTSWTNISQTSAMSVQTSVVGPNGSVYANATRAFTFGTDLGSTFVESSSTGGGYPITGNATTFMFGFQQEWTEQSSTVALAASGVRATSSDGLDNEVTGANGIYSAEETLASASASPTFIAFSFVQSATPKYTAEVTSGAAGTSGYSHILSGSDYQPTDPNAAETILENRYENVPLPLAASVRATPDPVDVGQGVSLAANAHGGAGVYSYLWVGLPAGCATANSSVLSCSPAVAGTFAPLAVVTDSAGNSAPTSPTVLVVSPALNATVVPSSPGADVGSPLSFSVAIAGGTPPYACTWSVAGSGSTGPCNASVATGTTVAGSVVGAVSVSDATGAIVNATSSAVAINDPLIVLLQAANQTATTRVGEGATFTVSLEGGTAPFEVSWYEGSTLLSGFNGTSATIVSPVKGNFTISVHVADAAGSQSSSNDLTLTVQPAGSGNGSGPPPSVASSGSDVTFWVAVLLAALAGVEAILLVAKYLPPRPPSRQA